MRATQTLPAGYSVSGAINLKENRRLLIALNLLGLPWAAVCAVFFIAMAFLLHGPSSSGDFTLTLPFLALGIVGLIVTTAVTLVLHELVHGVFFWLFTRARPRFGIGLTYAYAAAPGWYIPRGRFLTTGLAPLIVLTAAGLLVLPIVPYPAAILLLVALFVNAAGAIGDLYMVWRIVLAPRGVLIEDQGDGVRWFAPGA